MSAAAAPVPALDDWQAWARHVNPTLAGLLQWTQRDQRFVHALGNKLTCMRGEIYTDWIAGFGALALGHRPALAMEALALFAREHAPHLLVEASNPDAGALARALCEATRGDFATVFFSNSGTEAVEAALKVCLAATGRKTIVHCSGAYHGTTLGSLAMMAPGVFRDPFEAALVKWHVLDFNDVAALDAVPWSDVAALVVEPIQVESGVQAASSRFLHEARRRCSAHGALLVFDEVQTGLGRSGARFAYERVGVVPDVLCLAKALGLGVVPIGATLMAERLFEAAYGSVERAESHHSTYGGNALACRVALAAVHVLCDGHFLSQVAQRAERLQAKARAAWADHPLVQRVEFHGLLGVIELRELTHPWFDWAGLGLPQWSGRPCSGPLLLHRLHRRRLLLQPCGHAQQCLRIQPPLVFDDADGDALVAAVRTELDWLAAHE